MRARFSPRAVAFVMAALTVAGAEGATFVVTSTADSGAGSLRQAILNANGLAGADTITFNIPGGGVRTILLTTVLPDVTGPTLIDGSTQPGYVAGGQPMVVINGGAPASGNGLTLRATSTVRALTIQEFEEPPGPGAGMVGILVDAAAAGTVIEDCYIGTAATGAAALGNYYGIYSSAPGVVIFRCVVSGNGEGVYLRNGSATIVGCKVGTNAAGTVAIPNTFRGIVSEAGGPFTIGSSSATGRNIISGNGPSGGGSGIELHTSNDVVRGNYIGLNAAGTAAIPNGLRGVEVYGPGCTIGGAAPGEGNVISGNALDGIGLMAATGATVQGNRIGTDVSGLVDLGNGGDGVEVSGGGNAIGTAAAGNVISGNGAGVRITGGATANTVKGNLIGTNALGNAALGNGVGVEVAGGVTHTIGGTTPAERNVISASGNSGVLIDAGASAIVQGNYIGTSSDGTIDLGNGFIGVEVLGTATVGGTAAGAGNVISGNAWGVVLWAGGSTVQGNFIGTNAAGAAAIPNTNEGIDARGIGSTIGGTTAAARNVISGNGGIGVNLPANSGHVVQGNYIGTDSTGVLPLPNGEAGVRITSFNCTIGGTANGAGNLIAFNGEEGVLVASGNGNAVQRNSIHSNGLLGIDLYNGGAHGVSPNDATDGDSGSNLTQNFPVLECVGRVGSLTVFRGTLQSTPNTLFRVDLYSNAACDASGHGEGRTFLDFITLATNASGQASFALSRSLASPPAIGQFVTATATDPSGNTSEFCACAPVTDGVGCPVRAWFVDAGATGANNGNSWTDAFTSLQSALSAVHPAEAIWVADGTYRPTAGADRAATFTLAPDILVLGGFAGNESAASQRNPSVNTSILSGELGVAGDLADNTLRIVTVPPGVGVSTLLDGFRITRGNASPSPSTGSGLFIDRASITVVRCVFFDNHSTGICAAVHMIEPPVSPQFIGCAFVANRTGVFSVNKVSGGDGGEAPVFTNCLLARNTAPGAGAIGSVYPAGARFNNCTLADNVSDSPFLTLTAFNLPSGASQLVFRNCVFTGNGPGLFEPDAVVTATYSNMQNGQAGAGNINADPRYIDPDGPDQAPGSLDDDYRPGPGSPGIDAARNSDVPAGTLVDLPGSPRFLDATLIADTGSGAPPIVDMGCYEAAANTPRCAADADSSGTVNPADVAAFINVWSQSLQQGTLAGDFDHNGVVNPSDVAGFISAWSAAVSGGCF